MFKEVGFPVLKIKRFQIGNIALDEMEPGQNRRISKAELEDLQKALQGIEP